MNRPLRSGPRREGCKGEYRNASGSWSFEGNSVTFDPGIDDEPILAQPPELLVVPRNGAYHLARPEDVRNQRFGETIVFQRSGE